MTLRQDHRSRTRIRAALRDTRRRSPCCRHPEGSITGICASCLRERLYCLDVSPASSAAPPELVRCRSYASTSKCGRSSFDLHEPCRNPRDVFSSRSSMSALFGAEDLRSGLVSEQRFDSNNAGLTRATYRVIESKNKDQTTESDNEMEESNEEQVNSNEEADEECKTVKEFIDLEFQNRTAKSNSKHPKGMAGTLFGAASVVSKKFLKWRQKNKDSKNPDNISESYNIVKETRNPKEFTHHSPYLGRRSCDKRPTFSLDPARSSFEERRASWDGYMIAKTIPRLAPMLSVVENDIMGNRNNFDRHRRLSVDGTIYSTVEDGCSSGASGSGNSNSDSSSSMRQSSFDRSSSVRSSGNGKLVITEKELKDWHLNSGLQKLKSADGISYSDTPVKKSVKWRKFYNALGFRAKHSETMSSMNQVKDWKPGRSSIDLGSIYSSDAMDLIHGRRSLDTKYSSAYFDSSVIPFGNLRNYKSPHYMAASSLHMN